MSPRATWRLRVYGLAIALVALLASAGLWGETADNVIRNLNRPLYLPAQPVEPRETARPHLKDDPGSPSFHFYGGDYVQDPIPPYVYLMGREITRDLAGPTREFVGDGLPDTWLRWNPRTLGFYIGQGGGFYVTNLILRTKGMPYRRWDTVPNSKYPLLQVEVDGKRINTASGSVAGFNPPRDKTVNLYFADDELIATRHWPLEFIIQSLDGEYRMDVDLHNLRDSKID